LILNDVYDSGGWCGDIKRNMIRDLVLKSNAKLCVEIGVLKGSSLMCFAEGLSHTEGKVIGIDPYSYEGFKNHIPFEDLNDLVYNKIFTGQHVLDNLYSNLVNVIEENNLNNIIQLVRDFSENYYMNIERESVDILHIDGNHDEKHVTMDILYYLPLVKNNGYIIMDDITWDGVKKSIDNHLVDRCHFIGNFNNNEFGVYVKR
jgi:predicted O-methyltransferase YrrM